MACLDDLAPTQDHVSWSRASGAAELIRLPTRGVTWRLEACPVGTVGEVTRMREWCFLQLPRECLTVAPHVLDIPHRQARPLPARIATRVTNSSAGSSPAFRPSSSLEPTRFHTTSISMYDGVLLPHRPPSLARSQLPLWTPHLLHGQGACCLRSKVPAA